MAGKGPGGLGGQPAECESAVYCCSSEGKPDPELHPQQHY